MMSDQLLPFYVADYFQAREVIHSGQMSDVYFGIDTDSGLPVAIKLIKSLHPDPIRQELFRRESRALKTLKHNHIVQLVDSGWSDTLEKFYIITQYQGNSLDKYLQSLRNRSPVTTDNSWYWVMLQGLCDALAHAHSQHIIHRDIKPSNILLSDERANHPYLCDFGISKIKGDLAVGQTLRSFTSPGYTAPEILNGEKGDERSDIYSLGMILYEILSGYPPSNEGPTEQELIDACRQVGNWTQTILTRSTSLLPENRYQTIQELMRDIELSRQNEYLDDYIIILDAGAVRTLKNLGLIDRENMGDAREAVLDQLGGTDANPCYVTDVVDRRSQEWESDIRIYGRTVSFVCHPVGNGKTGRPNQALLISQISARYSPSNQIDERFSVKIRGYWDFRNLDFWNDGTTDSECLKSGANIQNLLQELASLRQISRTQITRRDELRNKRSDLMGAWNKAIPLEKKLLDEKYGSVKFTSIDVDEHQITYFIAPNSKIPDAWELDTRVAVRGKEQDPPVSVGAILDRADDRVIVARDSYAPMRQNPEAIDDTVLITNGILGPDIRIEMSLINRKQNALKAFDSGRMTNPRIADVIADPSSSNHSRIRDNISWYQDWMDDDKKNAVKRALATEDIFIIKGPPGTGKTTVIAELVSQILRNNPSSRILITSHSNVAVDNALDQVGSIKSDNLPRILRMGHRPNMGQSADQWMVEAQISVWKDTLLERIQPYEETLDQEIKELRRSRRSGVKSPDDQYSEVGEDNFTYIRALLSETREKLLLINDVANDVIGSVHRNSSDIYSDLINVDIESQIASIRQEVESDLQAIRELWPVPMQSESDPDLAEEIDRLLKESEPEDDTSTELATKLSLRKLINEWKKIAGNGDEFHQHLADRANVLGVTCVFSGRKQHSDITYDWVIVDEAGKAAPPDILIPINKGHKVILVGDDKQLPPYVDHDLRPELLRQTGIERNDLETSLFEDVLTNAVEHNPETVCLLKTQYRMHPHIARLVNDVFYDGTLQNGVNNADRVHGIEWVPNNVVWYSTSFLPDRFERRHNQSFVNPTETRIIAGLLERLETTLRTMDKTKTIGILAGYSSQKFHITNVIQPDDTAKWQALNIEIDTVDAIQGREKDFIIYSTVRSNVSSTIGFLSDSRRINVAFSRARELLMIVGDADMINKVGTLDTNPFIGILTHINQHTDECTLEFWENK